MLHVVTTKRPQKHNHNKEDGVKLWEVIYTCVGKCRLIVINSNTKYTGFCVLTTVTDFCPPLYVYGLDGDMISWMYTYPQTHKICTALYISVILQ